MLLWPEFLCLPPLISLTVAGSVDIEAVTNQTFAEYSGKPLSTYSIQEALYNDPYEEDLSLTSNLYLFTDACKQADGTSNCTTACSDNATIFENLETWHNCMHYPTIAFQYANNSLSDNAVRTVQGLGIIGHKTNSSTAATTDAIRTCLVDYCSSNAKGCEAEFQRVSTSYDEGYPIPTPYFNSTYWDFERDGYQLIEYICDFSSYPVNPDIGGIGVYVSYWIQTGIALIAFFATLLLKSWIYHISLGFLTLRFGWRKATEKAQRIRIRNIKHLSRLAVALTDFQKAQCFFMLAINIAAQVVIRKGGLQPQSLQQIYDTYIFIKVLAISGFLPITFTLFTLHLIGMVSWYLMALSFLSVALSIVTLLTIGEFNPSQADMIDLASSYATGGPSSCGNAQPAAFCYSPVGYYYGPSLDTFSIGDVAFRMLGFCLVVFLLLVVGKSRVLQWPMAQRFTRWLADKLTPCLAFFPSISSCARKLSRYPVVKRFTHWMMEKGAFCLSILVHFADTVRWRVATQPTLHRSSVSLSRRMAPWKQSDRYVMGKRFVVRSCNEFWSNTARFFRSTTCTKATRKCIIIATYLTMSGLYIYWFIIFAQDLAYFAINGNYSKTWNFGQIVAITVWAPPLCEYIHLELRGMRRGFDHKLLPPYRITKIKDDETAALDIESSRARPNGTCPDDNPEGGDYGQLLPLQQITSAKDCKDAAAEPKSENSAPNESYLDNTQSAEYGRLNSIDLNDSARNSEEDVTWPIPPTALPEGGLSPF